MPPVKADMVHFSQNLLENHGDDNATSLQDAFRKFRDQRKKEIKAAVKDFQKFKRSQGEKNILRERFIEQIKKYIGVPYARKYHDKDSPDYTSPLFLDCCGLIRRALKDLKKDFGFNIGHWNQAYMYDTLPITLTEDDMKPGDLVFISGKYYGENRRRQIHNMVHVEMWLGEEEKTIGARWHRGRVQVHDSYQFVSKSYYDMKYHFKSIETWLEGTCKSFCPEHPWTRRKSTTHGKKSIFFTLDMKSSGQQSDCPSESQQMSISYRSSSFFSGASDVHRKKHQKRKRLKHKNEERTPLEQQSDNPLVKNHEQDIGQKEKCLPRTVRDPPDEHHLVEQEFQVQLLQEHCELEACQHFDLLSWEGEVTVGRETIVDSEELEEATDPPVQRLNSAKSDSCQLEVKGESFLQFVVPTGVTNGKFRSCPMLKKAPDGVYSARQQNKAGRKGKLVGEDRGEKAGRKQSSVPQITLEPRVVSEHPQDKTFFIGGQNGVLLVQAPLQSMGWKRIFDPRDSKFHLKWVECKSQINYSAFREGQQMVNHIPNGGILTSKAGLRRTLEEHERVLGRLKNTPVSSQPNLSDFYPETYGISGVAELKRFQEIFKDGEVWICKPSGSNQGKGIFLVDNLQLLEDKLGFRNDKNGRRHSERVIQRYIPNPLLLEGRKFDIRVYMLIASTAPYMIYYHKGYVRLSCVPFSVESPDIHAHLTNQYIQKKHPSYQEKKEETVWPFERFNEYVNVHYATSKGIPEDWVLTQLKYRMKEIMLTCFKAAKNKLERRLGFFDLLGFDFMVDETMKVWLIEINVNPALHTNCVTLRNLMPGLIEETLKVCIELFEKKRNKLRLRPVASVKNFELLYNGETQTCFKQCKPRRPLAQTRPDGAITEPGEELLKSSSEIEDKPLPVDVEQSNETAFLKLENEAQKLSLDHSTQHMAESSENQQQNLSNNHKNELTDKCR